MAYASQIPDRMASMALAGNVETIGLSSIFLFISTNNLTGLFTVKSDDGELTFCFTKGNIFFPKDERRTTYTLAGMLRKTGRLTKYINKNQLSGTTDDALEEILIKSGSATERELKKARSMAFEEEIYDLFLWRRAYFEFTPGGEPKKMRLALQTNNGYHFNTQGVLMEAARRADDLSRIRHMLPSMKSIFEISAGKESAIDKQIKDNAINSSHRAFDGLTPINTILSDWKVPYTMALAMIAKLVESGFLCVLDRQKSAQRAQKNLSHQKEVKLKLWIF